MKKTKSNTVSKTQEPASTASSSDILSSPSTPNFRLIKIQKSDGSISKRLSRNESGSIIVDSTQCALSKGTATTVAISGGMTELAKLYENLRHDEAVVLSNVDLGTEQRPICTKADYLSLRAKTPDIITRSREFMGSTSGPGLQLFEVDDHGLPAGQTAPDAQKMVEILSELLPELNVQTAAKLLSHSASSHIYDKATGEILKGEGGKHLTMLLSEQSAAGRLKELLEVRQWANGHGHIHISRDGRQLERTVFDLTVFAPERLVFEAGAALSDDLEQRRPTPVTTEGHALDMSLLPAVTLEERQRANAAILAAKEATISQAQEQRNKYMAEESSKLIARLGVEEVEAQRIVNCRVESGLLDDRDVLTFTDTTPPESEIVGNVLDAIANYLGRPMCDPAEPEYGPSKAMILRGPGGQPFVQSYAHGGRKFMFQRIQGQEGATTQALFGFSDLANAHRISNAFGSSLISSGKGWAVYTGKYWKQDEQLAEQKALNLSRLVLKDPEYIRLEKQIESNMFSSLEEAKETKSLRQKWLNFGRSCENQAKISAALKIARTLLWHDMGDMNFDPWLFNVLNGTIDLRTGKLRPHNRDDMITMLAPVNFLPDEKCPIFDKTLREIFAEDDSVIGFLQRYLGYSLTGVTSEQKILIPWGDGSNGKGTILNQVQNILGSEYCGSAAPKLLENTRVDRHPTEIADLYGKRLVIASETEEGAQLREAFLKFATGGDKLKGRFMHQDFFEFNPTHKFVLQTNHKPEVKGADYAVWRRLMLLPFEVIFGDQHAIDSGEATKIKDKDLQNRLDSEREGIFAWMVRGCMDWQKVGLNPPPKVIAATDSYRDEQDRLGQFIDEECEFNPSQSTERSYAYQCYSNWSVRNGYYALGIGRFHKLLLKAGKGKIADGKSTSGPRKNVSIFKGLSIRA